MIDCFEFARRLIQTPSLSGQEGEIAALVAETMRRIGFDDVKTDRAGNVIGYVRGTGRAPALMFNTHLDHVDVGDPAAWPFPPFEAVLDQGKIWGRGAVDIKGPLAAQVYAVGALATSQRPPGDVYVTAVVQEEVGGLGALELLGFVDADVVVVGEPSRNQLRRGHRGRTELQLVVRGRSVHASIPEAGVNPLEVVAAFVQKLRSVERGRDPDLGSSSVAPTLLVTDQESTNVIPGLVRLTCDWRSIPGETAEKIQDRLQSLADVCRIEGSQVEVTVLDIDLLTYTGLTARIPAAHPPFLLPADDEVVLTAERILLEALGRDPATSVWHFATDGGHFAAAGKKVLGFGPGDDRLAHTIEESIGLDELELALEGYRALALQLNA